MIFSDFHFYSNTLGIQTTAYVLMPEMDVMRTQKKPLPVLYLLHGLSDDHTMWMRQTAVEQYAKNYRVCIVMPAVNRSFYMDMERGAKYDTFVAEELPQIIERYFPVSKKREDRFAAGLSMGGYGALKLGLARPNRYAAVASFSGALGMDRVFQRRNELSAGYMKEMENIYGTEEKLLKGNGNLFRLAEKLEKKPEKRPRIYIACGTEDHLFHANERFVERFGESLKVEYHTQPGTHSWLLWNEDIRRVLEWLGLEKAV